MTPSCKSNPPTTWPAAARPRNRVLRNTYWLLALSMIPTVLGAFVGVSLRAADAARLHGLRHVPGDRLRLHLRDRKDQGIGVGVAVLLGFTFFMGLMLTPLLRPHARLQQRRQLIMTAFGGTASSSP
jgi:modulator of FtsH protease